jgi:hypothetical protein
MKIVESDISCSMAANTNKDFYKICYLTGDEDNLLAKGDSEGDGSISNVLTGSESGTPCCSSKLASPTFRSIEDDSSAVFYPEGEGSISNVLTGSESSTKGCSSMLAKVKLTSPTFRNKG